MEAARILEAIKASSVERIAFVDDAFDPPEIPEADWGELREYLSAIDADQIRREAAIDDDDWQAAIEGIDSSVPEPVDELLQQLYAAYVRTFDAKFDPMGRFSELKGANLAYVRPLLALVRQASPNVTVQTYGSQPEAVDAQGGPHVVFVDLFLHASVSPDEAPDSAQAGQAVQKSLERIEPLLRLSPSVILMTSHPDAPQVQEYRRSMGEQNRVYASRFGFVSKRKIVQNDPADPIVVDPEASDTLLDLFQTYNFGRGLHETLNAWLKAAHSAVESLKGEIDDLELSDLAYLVRFRLSDEGQSLTDYLEWLLGECLIDGVGRKLDESLPKTQLDKQAKDIDSAFDGPTRKVAELYHRVRIENKRSRPREHFRLGDLYMRTPENGVPHLLAIMNPDCDLVKRPGKEKPAAHAMLTLRGKLETFNAPSTSVGDFIVIDDKPQNIKWDYRAVETLPFSGVMSQAGHSEGEFRYLGALRPMYAQEIQAKLLNQLGRVGVPVPPVLAFPGTVTFWYAEKSGKLTSIDFADEDTPCYFVPARQSDQEGILVFRRHFIRKLVANLELIDASTLSTDAAGHLKNLLSEAGRIKLRKLTAEGVELEKDIGHGLLLTKKKAKLGNKSAHWGCIVVAMKPESPAQLGDGDTVSIASADAPSVAEAASPASEPASSPGEAAASPAGESIPPTDEAAALPSAEPIVPMAEATLPRREGAPPASEATPAAGQA
ncbi:TPA: hypothetical protein QDB04_001971 [Burkholderia vietnamiensis]|nr:hypothetical protein [Burkholderia vietnamiensis]